MAPKLEPAIVTEVPTAPELGVRLLMPGVTEKLAPLLAAAFTVTTTVAVPAATLLGTGTTMLVALQELGVALTPAMVTVLVPCAAPKFEPAMVIAVPTGPEVGDRLLITGVTLNTAVLLAAPFTVTITLALPAAALLGTGATMLVALQELGVALAPPMVTVLVPCVAPKLEPAMVTDVPVAPDVGDRLLTTGVTLKTAVLLATPPTVTTTLALPGARVDGTTATMLLALQDVGVTATPAMVTVLVP